METTTPLEKAVKIVGNPNRLADAIDRSQSTVWGWMQRGWPSPDACLDIERATGGKIKAADLLKPAFNAKPKKRRAA